MFGIETKRRETEKEKSIERPLQDELMTILQRLTMKITDIESRVRNLEMNEEDLRNKVLRKIQKSQDINTRYGLRRV